MGSLLLTGVGGRGAAAGILLAQVEKTSNQTGADYSTATAITWDQEQVDTAGVWSAGAPTKFVIPAALNGMYAVFLASVHTAAWSLTTAGLRINIRKNGNINWLGAGGANNRCNLGAEANGDRIILQCETQAVQLATGDEFDVLMQSFGDTAIDMTAARSSFGMYVIGSVEGCLVNRSADLTAQNFNFTTLTGWNQEVYDTNGYHDTVTNSGRITIPSAVNGRYGIVRARIRLEAVATNSDYSVGILKNGGGFSGTLWPAIGTRSGNNGSQDATGIQFMEVDTQPFLLTTGDFYEIQLKSSDTSTNLIAAWSTFGIEVFPVGFQGVLGKINADLTTQNYSAGTALSYNATDVYDTDAAHDPSGTPTQIIIPASLNGKWGILQANAYATSSTNAQITVIIDQDTGGGASPSYDGAGGWGTDATSTSYCWGRSQIVQLVTGHKYRVIYYNSDTSITLEEEGSSFSLRVLA